MSSCDFAFIRGSIFHGRKSTTKTVHNNNFPVLREEYSLYGTLIHHSRKLRGSKILQTLEDWWPVRKTFTSLNISCMLLLGMIEYKQIKCDIFKNSYFLSVQKMCSCDLSCIGLVLV